EDADQRPEEAGCGRTRRGPIEGLAIDFVGERQVLGDLPWRPFARRPWLTPPLGGDAAGRGGKSLARLMMVAGACLEIGHDVLHSRRSAQILLYEAWAQVHVELDQRRIANAAEAVNLAGLDDENVTRSGLEFLAVHGPEPATLPDELDFVIRIPMRP